MIEWREAQARALALATPVAVELVALHDAAGRWTADALTARRTQPARDLSSMDGYAIAAADLPGGWQIIGQSAPGAPYHGTIGARQAVRIFTGAAVPPGTDTILIQEDAHREAERLKFTGAKPPNAGSAIRRAGSDLVAGQVVVEAGQLLTPARIGLAAIAGIGTLPVRRRVRVAILSTGDELVPAGLTCDDDHLPNANAPMLAAMLAAMPVDVDDFGIVGDRLAALTTALGKACDHDLILISGGASVGDHDLVRPALVALGGILDFWRVSMRPGKPMLAGRLGDAVVLGLPGNPVSAFVTALLFAQPVIRRLAGAAAPCQPVLTAAVAAAMPGVGPRTEFVRARWHRGALLPLASTDSAILSSLAKADALIVRPAHAAAVATGGRVDTLLLG